MQQPCLLRLVFLMTRVEPDRVPQIWWQVAVIAVTLVGEPLCTVSHQYFGTNIFGNIPTIMLFSQTSLVDRVTCLDKVKSQLSRNRCYVTRTSCHCRYDVDVYKLPEANHRLFCNRDSNY